MPDQEAKNVTAPPHSADRPHPAKKSGRIRILFILAVVAALAVSAMAASQFYAAYRLPDPATTDTDGLIRWLVTVDLEQHPSDVQSILARRLEEEFGDTTDWSELKSRLTDEYSQQLWSNIQILLRPWFFEKMERYNIGTPAERIEGSRPVTRSSRNLARDRRACTGPAKSTPRRPASTLPSLWAKSASGKKPVRPKRPNN